MQHRQRSQLHLPRFFCPPLMFPPLFKLLLLVMELLLSVFCCFSCSVDVGDLPRSFSSRSIAFKLLRLDVDPLWEPPLVCFDVFSMLSIKLLTDKRESWRVINAAGTTTAVPLVVPFLTMVPLVFCLRRCAISCWTVVRIDCCDSLDDATTAINFWEKKGKGKLIKWEIKLGKNKWKFQFWILKTLITI